MISEIIFKGFQLLGINTDELAKLDSDYDSLQARIDKTEAELAQLRPSQDDFDAATTKLETKVKSYRSQLASVSESISQAVEHLQNTIKVNPTEYIQADLDKCKELDKEVLNALFQARDILKQRGEITEVLLSKTDVLEALGADVTGPQNAWGDRWTGYELQWPAYTARHALLFAGGQGATNSWNIFSDGEV